jgi:hypothetical protein
VAGFGPLQPFLDDAAVEEFRLCPRPSLGAVAAAERTLMPMSVRLDVAHERILGTPQRLEAS